LAKENEGASPADAFIREVDEEYRRDQLAGFWARFGRPLLIAIGLGLVALAAFLWWREEQAKALGETSEAYSKALQGLEVGSPDAKAELDRIAAGDAGGYAALARFRTAQIAAENGDSKTAIDAYAALAADTALPKSMRDLAVIKSARLRFDDAPPAELVAMLKPLGQPGNAWFGIAGELLAVAYVKDGKPELAGPIFASISSDETVPPPVRARAQQMAASLGTLAVPDPSAAPAAQAAEKANR
jgi:hypothetical protein